MFMEMKAHDVRSCVCVCGDLKTSAAVISGAGFQHRKYTQTCGNHTRVLSHTKGNGRVP